MRKEAIVSGRRDLLKAAGAGLVAAAGLAGAQARGDEDAAEAPGREESLHGPKPVYLYGCGWNRELPGVFGELCLTFDMRAELDGTGLGTFRDDVHPEINSQFQINSAKKQGQVHLRGRGHQVPDPSMVGMAVKIVAEKTGGRKGKASITVGSEDRTWSSSRSLRS
jgi:hypothetical protein